MATREMIVNFEFVFETLVSVRLEDDETLDDAVESMFDGGLKQYIKDYDPDFGYDRPVKVSVKRVENKLGG